MLSSELRPNYAPGIGMADEVVISNSGTRAVFVSDSISCDEVDLVKNWDYLRNQSPWLVSRYVLKAISSEPWQIGEHLAPSKGIIEACIPFTNVAEEFYWLVIGKNYGDRTPNHELINTQRDFITKINQEYQYQPQQGEDLKNAVFRLNSGISDLVLTQITPANITIFEEGLETVYETAFSDYPYNIVETIKKSCGYNFYVVALVDGRVAAVTGAERIEVSGIELAEVGDSAALPELKGLGAVTKRFLLQLLYEQGKIPTLIFTDSRIGDVIKANRRAGFILDNRIILPWHTQISSPRDGDSAKKILGEDGVVFSVENMTMTYLDRNRLIQVIEELGPIPI